MSIQIENIENDNNYQKLTKVIGKNLNLKNHQKDKHFNKFDQILKDLKLKKLQINIFPTNNKSENFNVNNLNEVVINDNLSNNNTPEFKNTTQNNYNTIDTGTNTHLFTSSNTNFNKQILTSPTSTKDLLNKIRSDIKEFSGSNLSNSKPNRYSKSITTNYNEGNNIKIKNVKFLEKQNLIKNVPKSPTKSNRGNFLSPTRSNYSENESKFSENKVKNILDKNVQLKKSQVNEVYEFTISPKHRTKNLTTVIDKINENRNEQMVRNMTEIKLLRRKNFIIESYDKFTDKFSNKITDKFNERSEKMKNKKSKAYKVPLFKSGIGLNNFLISDFLIGQELNPSLSSLRKTAITDKMYQFKDDQINMKIKKAKEEFEIKKFGAVILGESIDEIKEDKILNDKEEILEQIKKINEIEKEKIKERSIKIGEMIEKIPIKDYVENIPKNMTSSLLINKNNLERVIQLREIMKKKDNKVEDFEFADIEKFNIERKDNDNLVKMCLRTLGPPSFLKKNFRKTTNEKFRTVNGKFFGCKV